MEVIAGRYELEELVGTGGMSSVYRAHDTLLERRVALKLLHDHVARDQEQVERFRREARAVAQLSHPNIVTIIDRGARDGHQYIVFEYIEGENLKQLVLRTGPLPVRQALEVAIQVAGALGFAHRQGLVHRDVKPQNVLLPAGGEAKVTDFGIARSIDVEGLTQTGSVIGTSHYIAPEQARGRAVDARSDVYSLGAVLFELLTGEVPFPGESFIAVALRHVNDPAPSVRERRPDASPRLDAAVGRALAKDPGARFQSMEELVGELHTCLAELGPDTEREETMVVRAAAPAPAAAPGPDRPLRHRRGRKAPIILALAVGLAAAAVVVGILVGVPDLSGGDGGSGKGSTPPPAGLRDVRLNAISSWDPEGDRSEHDETVRNATDGDSNTYWTTEGYNSGLGDKPGVGIVLDAGREVRVSQVRVSSDTSGFTAEIQAGESAQGPFTRVSPSAQVADARTFVLAKDTKTRYLLIWITELAHPDKYRAHINEVTAKG